MRILVDARTGWGAGIGRYVTNIVPLVATLMPEALFNILVPPAEYDKAKRLFAMLANIEVTACDIAPFSAREQFALERFAAGHDLTWFTNYWVPLGWKGRYFAVVHDLLHLRPDLLPASPLKRIAAHLTFRKLQKSAAGLLFISRFTQRQFEKKFGTPRESRVQHNGIDHAGWQPFDPENPPAKAKRVLAVGAPKKHKNFETAIEAWRSAKVSDDWIFTIVAPRLDLRSGIDLEAMIRDVDRIDLRRNISNEELRHLYSEAAIILTPSLYEGFGLPLLEGMQAGAACISAPAEALVEISSGATIEFVNGQDIPGWAEAIERACRKHPVNKDIQKANMLYARAYSWSRVAQVTTELISDALMLSRPIVPEA